MGDGDLPIGFRRDADGDAALCDDLCALMAKHCITARDGRNGTSDTTRPLIHINWRPSAAFKPPVPYQSCAIACRQASPRQAAPPHLIADPRQSATQRRAAGRDKTGQRETVRI